MSSNKNMIFIIPITNSHSDVSIMTVIKKKCKSFSPWTFCNFNELQSVPIAKTSLHSYLSARK